MFETGTNQLAQATTPGRRRRRRRSRSTSTPSGKLAFDAARRAAADDGFDEYVSDPAKPVPYIDKIGDRHGRRST